MSSTRRPLAVAALGLAGCAAAVLLLSGCDDTRTTPAQPTKTVTKSVTQTPPPITQTETVTVTVPPQG